MPHRQRQEGQQKGSICPARAGQQQASRTSGTVGFASESHRRACTADSVRMLGPGGEAPPRPKNVRRKVKIVEASRETRLNRRADLRRAAQCSRYAALPRAARVDAGSGQAVPASAGRCCESGAKHVRHAHRRPPDQHPACNVSMAASARPVASTRRRQKASRSPWRAATVQQNTRRHAGASAHACGGIRHRPRVRSQQQHARAWLTARRPALPQAGPVGKFRLLHAPPRCQAGLLTRGARPLTRPLHQRESGPARARDAARLRAGRRGFRAPPAEPIASMKSGRFRARSASTAGRQIG